MGKPQRAQAENGGYDQGELKPLRQRSTRPHQLHDSVISEILLQRGYKMSDKSLKYYKHIIFTGLFLLLLPHLSFGEEYSFSPVLEGSATTEQYFDRSGYPKIHIATQCPQKGKCWPVIKNRSGKILKRFSTKDSISKIASGRYRGHASMLIKRGWKCGDDRCSEYFVIDDKGRRTGFIKDYKKRVKGKVFDLLLSKENNLIALTPEKIIVLKRDGSFAKTVQSPVKLETGILQNNPKGNIAAMAVGENSKILMGNLEEWIITDFVLSEHGDREGILGVYPDSEKIIYGVVYKYVNEYNKGLYLITANFNKRKFNKGMLLNSEDRNIGFDPDIHTEHNNVLISSKDSSNGKLIHFSLTKEEAEKIEDIIPSHLIGLTEEKYVSFLAGTGVSKISWISNSKVSEKIDDEYITYGEVDYDISESLFWLTQLEGRLGNTRIAISYLQNQAEEYVGEKAEEVGGKLTKEASKYIFSTIDFHGFISKSSTLRLIGERSELNGIATFKKADGLSQIEEFQTRYDRVAGLYIKERGLYFGLEYVNYKMPSVIGFSDKSKSIVYVDFDKDLGLNKISIMIGYDELAYTKRYETNYNKLYFAGNLGLGIGWLSISDEIEKNTKMQTGKTDINLPIVIALDGTLEVGYVYQRRAKRLKGLGYSINLGYRAKGTSMGSGQSKESKTSIEENELALEFGRYDILHGPFIQGSLIF